MIGIRRNNIRRYKQILNVFAKYGFGLLIDKLGIFNYLKIRKIPSNTELESQIRNISTGERIRLACEELGPTFIKLGQILSTRSDIIPSDIIEELKKLQDSVQPFPFAEVREAIETEFREKLENIYTEFHEKPIAAASISQVHYAKLHSGKRVAVKVQRPGIKNNINLDLNILKDLAYFIDNHTKYGEMYDLSGIVLDFDKTMKNELDFTKEGENAEIFKQNFINDKGVVVPKINWIYTTKCVITMEYIEGIRVNNHEALEKAGVDKRILAKGISTSICNQIFRDGFFHADPHPGNIRVLSDGTIVFLDFGMVGILKGSQKEIISNLFVGVVSKNSKMVVKSIIDLGSAPKRINLKKFEKDVDKIIDKYLTLSWNEIKIGTLFYEIFNTAFNNNIKIPNEFALLTRSMATLQGLLEELAPDLNALIITKPIVKKMVYQSFSAKNISKNIKKNLLNYKDLFEEFPSAMLNVLGKMEEDNFTIQFEIKEIDNIQKRFERIFNRISFSVILLAVSIIMAGVIIGSGLNASAGTEMYFLSIMVLKIGLGISGVIILGLIISMIRSGRS